MHRDRNGISLHVGDEVMLRCIITELRETGARIVRIANGTTFMLTDGDATLLELITPDGAEGNSL